MKNLKLFVRNTWDNDIMFNDATEHLEDEEIDTAEKFLTDNPEYIEGIPFKGDEEKWDNLLENEEGAKILQKIVDHNE